MGDYELLGLKPPCTSKEIRAAFIEKAKITHPDKGGTASDFRKVREAYNRIIDKSAQCGEAPMPAEGGWGFGWRYTSDDPPWMAEEPEYNKHDDEQCNDEPQEDYAYYEQSDDDTTAEEDNDDHED